MATPGLFTALQMEWGATPDPTVPSVTVPGSPRGQGERRCPSRWLELARVHWHGNSLSPLPAYAHQNSLSPVLPFWGPYSSPRSPCTPRDQARAGHRGAGVPSDLGPSSSVSRAGILVAPPIAARPQATCPLRPMGPLSQSRRAGDMKSRVYSCHAYTTGTQAGLDVSWLCCSNYVINHPGTSLSELSWG